MIGFPFATNKLVFPGSPIFTGEFIPEYPKFPPRPPKPPCNWLFPNPTIFF